MDTPTTTPDPPTSATPSTALAPKTDKVPVPMGIQFETLDQAYRFATAVANTEFVPKSYRGKPADILAAVQMGHELGLAPMQALSSLAVVNGFASLWGDGMLAVVQSSPHYQKHDEHFLVDGVRRDILTGDDLKKDTTGAVCIFWRHGRDPIKRTYTIGHAKRAGLWTKSGSWQTNPDRMLQMRARAFAARDQFPDVLRGIKTAEEMRDLPADESTPPVVREVRRVSDTPAPVDADIVESTPAPDVVVLDPAGVKSIEQFLGGYTCTLTTGMQVDVTNDTDAADLEKFIGTPVQLRLTCRRVVDRLELVAFAVVD